MTKKIIFYSPVNVHLIRHFKFFLSKDRCLLTFALLISNDQKRSNVKHVITSCDTQVTHICAYQSVSLTIRFALAMYFK